MLNTRSLQFTRAGARVNSRDDARIFHGLHSVNSIAVNCYLLNTRVPPRQVGPRYHISI